MSGFFGIFRPKGGQVDLDAFEQMKTAMHRDGFDGMETHVDNNIAMGHLMLRVSPESKYDKQPLKSSCGNYLLVGHFRLDYRDELGDKLGLTQAELERTPDSQLAMMSYQKWKEKCVHHLEGDWAFAAFNYIEKNISFFIDCSGCSALYHFIDNGEVFFSSDINIFLKIQRIKFSVDLVQYSRFSLRIFGLRDGCTLLQDVSTMPKGTICAFDINLVKFNKTYWDIDLAKKKKYKFDNDYLLDFINIFSSGIRSRLPFKTQLGIYLSSGYDSSLIAFFIGKEKEHLNERATSYTSFPAYLGKFDESQLFLVNEVPLIKNSTVKLPGIISHFCDFPEFDFLKLLKSDLMTDYSNPAINNNTFWIEGIMSLMKESKIQSAFNGQMGNFVISWNAPNILIEDLFKFRFYRIFRTLNNISKVNSQSLILTLYDTIYLKIIRIIKNYINNLTRRVKTPEPIFVKKGIVSKENWKKELNRLIFNPYKNRYLSSKLHRYSLFKSRINTSSLFWYRISNRYSILSIDPTCDKRLVQFSFSVPEYLFNNLGERRFLINSILGKSADSVAFKTNKNMIQSGDIFYRLTERTEFIDFLIKRFQGSSFKEYIEISKVCEYLHVLQRKQCDPLESRRLINFIFHEYSLLTFWENSNLVGIK